MLRVVLLTVMLACVSPSFAEETAVVDSTSPQVTNVAYYFCSTYRCSNCMTLEKYSHEAIQTGFADKLTTGELTWMMKNLDEEENAHFVDDFKLFTKALVLVRYENGKQTKWKNCDKIWELLNDEAAFKKYVQTEVASFLGS